MLSYEELLKKYNIALQTIDSLRAENKHLKSKLGIGEATASATTTNDRSAINKYSSVDSKIRLFRKLFSGREDVFAQRWYSKTTEKSGYQPVCENEWAEGICDKKTYKCSVCPNRKLLPLSDRAVYNHLVGKDEYGRDVIGIYPMLTDDTCRFLCADFDDAEFEKDVAAYRSVCEDLNLSVSIERSRSGNGAHAWIFFEEAVPAASARKMGTIILTKAMQLRGELSFKSYDRFFPNQDTMPVGGFGNLVALPLQGLARRSGNSIFVDESFIPYPDQWKYLASIQYVSPEQLEDIITKFGKNNELGELISDTEEKPWEAKKQHAFGQLDFPASLEIIRANMVYIPMIGLSSPALNALKRLAAFKNPDFYKMQAMRKSIYDKPRVICCADITKDYIALPRGCAKPLCDMLNEANVRYSIVDKTNPGTLIPVSFNGKLRDDQQKAADAILEHDTGVLSATTGFGKTVIASYLIAQRKVNTLILVHTQALLLQWKKSLEAFLCFDLTPPETPKRRGRRTVWSPIGTLGSQKNTLHGNVDIAIIQSALSDGEAKDLVKNYGMVIVDECHHISAVNFEKVLKSANAKYVYGLTATPTRQDGHHPIIFMQCGPIRYKVDAKEQAEKRPFEHYLIPRFTSFRSAADKTITTLYKELSEDQLRNNLIANDVIEALSNGRTPIILTERREHIETLSGLLSGKCDNIIILFGTGSQKEKRETLAELESIPDNEKLIIIATGKYVGEGFDYPRLDTLFLALPIAWKGKVAQYTGRLHRNYTGKTEVQVYDYVDIHVPMLEKMYQKRVKGYAAVGYKAKIKTNEPITPNLIYDGKSFYPVFADDVTHATKEILIVSPFMRKNRLTQTIILLSQVILNGVTVTVVTRPPEDFKEKESETVIQNAELLLGHGIQVKYKSEFHQKFTVIDQKVAWYGSVNFLSYGTHEESIMRFENYDLAGQLIDTVI
ncbi:MAG: DEAD/DEAH box helicase family protein [Ruminococcus sp.]|nr:DEAD/DEAH box helicase family protein [Ruminococcus sp.]